MLFFASLKRHHQHMYHALCLLTLAVFAMAAFDGRASAVSDSAEQTRLCVVVNGAQTHWLDGYTIRGGTYISLFSAAEALNGTPGQFNVSARGKQLDITPHAPYAAAPRETLRPLMGASPAYVVLDVGGKADTVPAYTIDGTAYFAPEDLAAPLHLSVDRAADAVYVTTYASEYSARTAREGASGSGYLDGGAATARWGVPSSHYIFAGADGAVQTMTVNKDDKKILVETYDAAFNLKSARSVPFECGMFGGFFSGERYNFIAFGNKNKEEKVGKEVFRVVKYDKAFRRLGSLSVFSGQCDTTVPYDAGTPDFAEHMGTLVLHTSRERYVTEDGLNHESQFTLVIDEETMKIDNATDLFQKNHVSHSFDQFAAFDGAAHVLLDHGDAYPRSVVLSRGADNTGKAYESVDLFDIPGPTGDNYTGVNVGGLAVTESHYIAAISSVNQAMAALETTRRFNESYRNDCFRDVWVLSVPKDNLTDDAVTATRLTNNAPAKRLAGAPRVVPLGESGAALIWQEFAIGDKGARLADCLKVARVSAAGELAAPIREIDYAALSKDCRPTYIDGAVTWFADDPMGRTFFSVPIK